MSAICVVPEGQLVIKTASDSKNTRAFLIRFLGHISAADTDICIEFGMWIQNWAPEASKCRQNPFPTKFKMPDWNRDSSTAGSSTLVKFGVWVHDTFLVIKPTTIGGTGCIKWQCYINGHLPSNNEKCHFTFVVYERVDRLIPKSLLLTVDIKLRVKYFCNCNCSNWGTCIAAPTRRPRARHRVNPYPGARRRNETKMFSDHDETSSSIAAVTQLFHARGAATEKALSPIRRRVRGTTRLPHDEACMEYCMEYWQPI